MSEETKRTNFMLDSSNFNIDFGYLEGIVRGFKSGILKQTDYLNLTQCENLEGKLRNTLKLYRKCLQHRSRYCNFGPYSTSSKHGSHFVHINSRLILKLFVEFALFVTR